MVNGFRYYRALESVSFQFGVQFGLATLYYRILPRSAQPYGYNYKASHARGLSVRVPGCQKLQVTA